MSVRLRRCVAVIVAWSALIGIGPSAARGQTIQAGGVAMSIVGLIGHEVPVEPARSSWRITPTVSRGVAGLAFGATF